jgi:hypothetical protein
MRRVAPVSASVFLALTAATAAPAQTIWTPIEHQLSVNVEALHPRFKLARDADVSALSGAVFLTGVLPVSPHGMIVIELPFARSSVAVAVAGESSSNSAFGNPYIGLQVGAGTSARGFVGELGVRPPIVGDNDAGAGSIGAWTDLDRLEAFTNKLTTLSGAANIYARGPRTRGRLRLGLTEQFFGQDVVDYETILDYGVLGSVDVDRLRLGAALTGRYPLTESGSFGDRAFHHAAASASMSFEQLRPGLFVRVPFDSDIREVVQSTFGITLEYTFR